LSFYSVIDTSQGLSIERWGGEEGETKRDEEDEGKEGEKGG